MNVISPVSLRWFRVVGEGSLESVRNKELHSYLGTKIICLSSLFPKDFKKGTADFEKCIVHGEYGIPISGIWSRIAAVFDLL